MSFAALAERLARRAATLAAARSESRIRARRRDGSQWRSADLLWPLFARKAD